MVAQVEVGSPPWLPVPEMKYFVSSAKANANVRQVPELVTVTTPFSVPIIETIQVSESVFTESSTAHYVGITSTETSLVKLSESTNNQEFFPSTRSGSFAHTGLRDSMEDEHMRIDDLSMCFGPTSDFPHPAAFYGVFDGHGGPEAAAFVKNNITKLLFKKTNFPLSTEVDEGFVGEVMNSLQRAYLLADQALADNHGVSHRTGTTALTAFIFGRLLVVANVGDCRAVLCRNGAAIDMSQDHRPTYIHERSRVEQLGAYVVNGRLNGVLSLTRALGDWDMKIQGLAGALSPLISDPEIRHEMLTEDDEFLILGSDGIWAVVSSHRAVKIVRQGLQKHNNPERAARKLVEESLWLGASDNVTVVVVCLSGSERQSTSSVQPRQWKLGLCSLGGFFGGGGSR